MKTFLSFQDPDKDDLLKWPVLLLVVTILLSAVWCGGVYRFRENKIRELQAAQANRIQKETSVQQIKEEEKTVRNFIDHYQSLVTEGVIGDEDRLELVEMVGRIRARHNLYPVQLDIEQQAFLPLGPDGEQNSSGKGASLRASRIQISIPLLHEEDLPHLFDELREMKRGIFVTEQCCIKRNSRDPGNERLLFQQNLTASCKILWLTIKRGEGEMSQENTIPESLNR
jgi:hypothetical protein